MAKDVRFIIKGDPQGAIAALKEMQAQGQSTAQLVGAAFRQLGVESSASLNAQRQAAVTSFELIKASGTATWTDIQKAHASMTDKLEALDKVDRFGKTTTGAKSLTQHIDTLGSSVDRLTGRFTAMVGGLALFYVGGKLWQGFQYGIGQVDQFTQSVTKTAAMITSLQGGKDIASNYQLAKQYAAGLNDVLMQVDSRTTLNLQNLQTITEEMTKQGVILDYTNKEQVEGFTRLANAVAVYSRNGADEMQLRSEVSALLRGEVDQNSQLASMIQRTVQGPLKQYVDQWRQSGTLVTELGGRLSGFGPAADDLATSWGAVKSSLETSVSLVMRAGMTDVVKDLAGWLGKINEYLKEHREEIGVKIKGAWETAKSLMSDAASIAKAIYNNFEPFAALIVGGALISGVTRLVSLFTTLRDIVISTRGAMLAMGAVSAGAGVAGAAGGAVAGGGILSAIGGGLAGTGIAIGGGLGLGYALQPAVRWVDKKLYQNFGWNLTGEAMYNEAQQRNAEADQRWKFFTTENANYRAPGASSVAAIPQLNLGDTPQQIKEKIELRSKERAAFKADQDAMTSIAKEQAGIRLSIIKANYDAGLTSTRDYYEAEKKVALDAAQQRFQNAADYLAREKKDLEFIESKMGKSSPEYANELRENKKAVGEMQSAQLAYGQTYLDYENRMTEALRKREEEYGKLVAATLDASGEYVRAEEYRQTAEQKSIDMLRLRKEAEEGVKGAVDALAAVEKKRAIDRAAADLKEREASRQYADEIAKLKDEVAVLNGADQERIKLEASLRDGLSKETQLRDKLTAATIAANRTDIAGLTEEIQLREIKLQRIRAEIELKNRAGELSGQIVGYNNGKPVYADAYQKEQAATGYVPNAQLRGGASNVTYVGGNSPFVNLSDPWLSGMPSFDVGTPYVPRDMIAKIHQGERIIPAAQNKGDFGAVTVSIGDINVNLPAGTPQANARETARAIYAELQQMGLRFRAA